MLNKQSFSLVQIIWISLISGVHLLFVNCLPYFLPILGRVHALSEVGLGDIASAYAAGTAVATLTSPWWLGKIAIRKAAVVQIAVVLFGLIGAVRLDTLSTLIAAFLVIGMGAGGLYALVISILGLSADPVRAYGIKVALGSLPAMACLSLFPMIFEGTSLTPIFGLTGLIVVLLCAGIFSLPRYLRLPVVEHQDGPNYQVWVALIALTLYMSGFYLIWPFIGIVGEQRTLSESAIGQILALSTVAATGTAFLAAVCGDRISRRLSLVTTMIVSLCGLSMMIFSSHMIGFAAGVILFIGPSGFAIPLITGLIARLDIGARRVGLSAAAITFAAVIGPAMGGRIIAHTSVAVASLLSAVIILSAIAIQIAQLQFLKRELLVGK